MLVGVDEAGKRLFFASEVRIGWSMIGGL